MKTIKDEFSALLKKDGTPMSRQQIYQLRKRKDGKCRTCGKPAVGAYCLEHGIAQRTIHYRAIGLTTDNVTPRLYGK